MIAIEIAEKARERVEQVERKMQSSILLSQVAIAISTFMAALATAMTIFAPTIQRWLGIN